MTITAQDLQKKDKHEYSLHLVEFIDKDYTPFSIFRPQEFLSAKAIERRITQGIEIDEQDLPIDPNYLEKILQTGAQIHSTSKWLNAIAIYTESIPILQKISKLPFVKKVSPLGKFRKAKEGKIFTKRPPIDSANHQESYYGLAENQIKMLNGIPLHQLGFTGKNVQVAVVDGGYNNVYRMAVFDSMYLENRLLGTKDFVDGDDFVYEESTHGSGVLSIMASKQPNLIVGTAPDASYYLFITEDVQGEYRAEEFNWVVAMEYADSVGVDVVNSSMGYSIFRDRGMSYTYQDLNGKKALITQGANAAVAKGLLVINSVGNDGHQEWHYLFAPADAFGIVAVASVEKDSTRSDFSSWGPTVDQRIKPDIAAQGGNTAYASMMAYDVGYGDGTSYSSPVMAGMFASFKQAFPTKTNEVIKNAIFESAHQFNHPDTSLGYGIPNFFEAYLKLSNPGFFIHHNGAITIPKQFCFDEIPIHIEGKNILVELKVTDLEGNQIFIDTKMLGLNNLHRLAIPNIDQLKSGVYALQITLNGQKSTYKFVVGY